MYFQVFTRRIFLFFIVTTLLSAPSLAHIDGSSDEKHGGVLELRDDNFDAHVFNKGLNQPPQSWIIFFFAPWCAHCKNLLPQFSNSSRILHESGMPHARFALVNAVRNKALASRYGIDAYPTLLYTTSRGERCNKFYGGYNMDSFVQFALYLQRAVEVGSFADLVSDPLYFQRVEAQMKDVRVPMFVWVPAKGTKHAGNRRTELRDAAWNVAVDAAASLGNTRFGVLYEGDVPDDWAQRGSASYVAVIKAARRCKGTGPDGEVFLVASDTHKEPHCYEEGPWLAQPDGKKDSNSAMSRTELHPSFEIFITRNGFRAVENMTPGFFSVLSAFNHHYIGLIVTKGPLAQTDSTIMPVLRRVVQERNEARLTSAVNVSVNMSAAPQRRIFLAHADGILYDVWRTRYRIEMDELPAIVVVDPRREKVYRLRHHTPRFEKIKTELPWLLDGEQQKILVNFLDDVEQGRAVGEKMKIVGVVAEFLLHFPGMEFVYETLDYDDPLFVTMVLAFNFFCFLLFVALVADPIMERRAAAKAKKD